MVDSRVTGLLGLDQRALSCVMPGTVSMKSAVDAQLLIVLLAGGVTSARFQAHSLMLRTLARFHFVHSADQSCSNCL